MFDDFMILYPYSCLRILRCLHCRDTIKAAFNADTITHTYRMYYLWPFPTDGDGFIPTLPYLGESGYSRCRRTVYSIYVYLINGLIWHVSRWFPEMGLPQTHGFQNVPYIINIHFRATMTMETPKNLIPCGAENGHHESKRPFHQWIFLIKLVKSI